MIIVDDLYFPSSVVIILDIGPKILWESEPFWTTFWWARFPKYQTSSIYFSAGQSYPSVKIDGFIDDNKVVSAFICWEYIALSEKKL